jgi:subtilisin family serine protease
MRRVAAAASLAIAVAIGTLTPAAAQTGGPGPTPTPTRTIPTTTSSIPPLGIYVMGGIACSAASPIIGTILLGREMTAAEVGRSTLGCFLGPVGWVLGPMLFPDVPVTTPPRGPAQPRGTQQAGGRNSVSIPPAGEVRFVRNEVLLQVEGGVSDAALATIARRLQLTRLETQSFTLTDRTLQRWRIDGNRSVAATLRALARYRAIAAAQPNYLYGLAQTAQSAPDTSAQYVIDKLHLTEAHRITGGDNVLVAVIDSRVDTRHPDLAGVIAGEFDALGGASKPHAHGTAMAGAIAANSKLIGVAPKVRLLAIRTFAGEGESAQGTTFNILKGIDWAASQNARIVNMSFAGPADAMLRDLLAKAHARGMVLIAAVGNAGPRSPPLYPAADAHVIGITATDADDKLMPQANRGPQVAVAAPGVDILAAAPDGQYTMTSGTSVAAAHASGVAALLLARKPDLAPDAVRRSLVRSAQPVPGKPREVGAGVIDALKAVNSLDR